ncbi:MAG: xylulokinase [Fimbriimonas sp.]
MAKLLGIDVGTSGCKVLLIDEHGTVLKEASAEYPISVPRALWSEQDPEDWWRGVQECLAKIGESSPDAIGVTGQMHGSVFLDANDQVIRPALLWNDQRTIEEVAEIEERVGHDRIREITCNPPLTGFQAPKVLWLRNHELSNYNRIHRVLLPKDFIRLRLTGTAATEVSDASGTGLLDVKQRQWSSELLNTLELDPTWFPPVYESDVASARTLAVAGLDAGIPVVGGGGDQAAGAVGTGAVAPGILSVSLGTSGVVFTSLTSPEFDRKGAAHTFCHANRAWHAMGVMLSCGGALRWYRDTIAGGTPYDELAAEAAMVQPGADGLTFLPYLTGERCPHNNPLARAAFTGLTLGHSRAHLSRAVFEGISFGLLDGFRLLKGLGADAQEIRVTSGGAKSAFWVQMLADLFQSPCATLVSDEGPAYGAALLAGVGSGIWANVSEATQAAIRVKKVTEPSQIDYSEAYARYQNLYPTLHE